MFQKFPVGIIQQGKINLGYLLKVHVLGVIDRSNNHLYISILKLPVIRGAFEVSPTVLVLSNQECMKSSNLDV